MIRTVMANKRVNEERRQDLVKVYIGTHNASIYSRVLKCNGRDVTITRSKPYLTSDKDELKELGKSMVLSFSKPTDEEVIKHIYDPKNLPAIINDKKLIAKNAAFWKWTQADEQLIANVLEKRGYEINYIKDFDPNAYFAKQMDETIIEVLEGRGYTVKKAKATKTIKPVVVKPVIVEPVKPKEEVVDYSDMTKAELLEEIKKKLPKGDILPKRNCNNAKLLEILNGLG